MRHNQQSTDAFMGWKANDIVGCFLNYSKKTISYYCNGNKLDDSVFKNISGKKFFPVVQICHSNAPVEVGKIIL
jgi:hypothetical protein